MLYNGTTVAFSTKANVWKTRYSFAPTCYMTMSNDFMSSNLTGMFSNNMAWKHDVNNTYNRFYDQDYPSSLEVVSNDNPSAVKIFKSLSIESNTTNWTGSVYTNKDRGMTALQEGNFTAFTEKEGNQYNAMPRSRINSTSQIVFVGSIRRAHLVPSEASAVTGLGEGYYPDPGSFNQALNGPWIYEDGSYEVPLVGGSQISVDFGSTNNPQTALFGAGLQTLNLYGVFTQLDSNNNLLAVSAAGLTEDPGIYITGYNAEYNTIRVQPNFNNPNPLSDANMSEQFMFEFTQPGVGLGGSFSDDLAVYILTDSTVNGDVMRGPYAGVNLTLNNASQPFELFAINVDYEKTKLDGSLG